MGRKGGRGGKGEGVAQCVGVRMAMRVCMRTGGRMVAGVHFAIGDRFAFRCFGGSLCVAPRCVVTGSLCGGAAFAIGAEVGVGVPLGGPLQGGFALHCIARRGHFTLLCIALQVGRVALLWGLLCGRVSVALRAALHRVCIAYGFCFALQREVALHGVCVA